MKRLSLVIAACALAAACSPQAEPTSDAAATPAASADATMPHGAMGGMDKMAMMAPAEGDSEATRGYKASMMTMMNDRPAYQGNADVDFMRQMRVHHQAAIAMARVELAEGENAEAQALAREIIEAQDREIGVIDTWRAANAG